MPMRDTELQAVVQALQRCIGAPLGGAWQPKRDRVLLDIGGTLLLLVPRGAHARLVSTQRRPRNPQKPFSFQGALRAHLGGRLEAITKVPGDRIVDLVFTHGRLHLRLVGGLGGLWLLEGDSVLAAYDGPAPEALPGTPSGAGDDRPPRFEPSEDEHWDQAADRWFGQAEARELREQRRTSVRRALRRELDRTRRLARNLEQDLDKAAGAPTLRRQADALAAVLHTLPRGSTDVAVLDLQQPDLTWNVTLDPTHPPAWSMERLYSKARRLDRMGDRVIERMDQTQARIDVLTTALAEVDEADDATLKRLAGLAPLQKRGSGQTGPNAPFIVWSGPAGERVRVGRDARSNRRLTFSASRGTDWWMHLRGKPGAHIVIRTQPGQTPPLATLLAAANIALIQAKVPVGSAADIQYTRIKDVRSIPGDSGGRVRLANEKVLRVTRDPAALVGWTREG